MDETSPALVFSSDQFVGPICLPEPGERFEPGFICTTVGWGRLTEDGLISQVLQEVNLPILTKDECITALLTLQKPISGQTFLCTGFPDGGKDACQTRASCDEQDRVISASEGELHFPESPFLFYESNQRCVWTLLVPEEMHVFLSFSHFDAESCHHNYLSIHSLEDRLIDSGCSSLTILFEEGLIQSLHYPEDYSDLANCNWVFQAPKHYLIKKLEIEESGDCTSDYVSVYRDVERKKEIARLCGFVVPAPVLSASGVMSISFQSDENATFRGFQATVSFVPETGKKIKAPTPWVPSLILLMW
ncbi:hypothetical protein CB1_000513028 [Camelus ferus]|nr:hypothetical protein CB1_000513028 [Camelus ferus]